MKKFILIILLCSFYFSFSQSWRYSEGSNVFDGKYKSTSVMGKGSEFPYSTPFLTVNFFNDNDFNFYISNSGYYQENTNIQLIWVFDKEPNIKYITNSFTISNDGKTIFLKFFKKQFFSDKIYSNLEIFEKMKSSNKVYVRVSDRYGSSDLEFSLIGFTKTINQVIPSEYRKNFFEKLEKENILKLEKEKRRKEEEKKKKENFEKISILLDEYLPQKEKQQILNVLDYKTVLHNIKFSEIDRVDFVQVISEIQLKLYSKENLVYTLKNVNEFVPSLIFKNNEIKLEKKSNIIEMISLKLEKLGMIDTEIKELCTKIISDSELNNSFDLYKSDSISIQLPTRFIKNSMFSIYDVNGKRIYFNQQLDSIIPIYLNELNSKSKNEISNKVLTLLDKFKLSEEEKLKILEKILKVNSYNFTKNELSVLEIEFNPDLESVTKIHLFRENGRLLHTIIVIDKEFTTQFKRKTLNKNL